MKAVTDSGPTEPNQPKPDAIQNIFQLMSVVSSADTLKFFEEQYNACQIRYGDMKKQLAVDMIAFTEPMRERIKSIGSDEAYISKVARLGKEKAQASAAQTIREVREIIGFKSF